MLFVEYGLAAIFLWSPTSGSNAAHIHQQNCHRFLLFLFSYVPQCVCVCVCLYLVSVSTSVPSKDSNSYAVCLLVIVFVAVFVALLTRRPTSAHAPLVFLCKVFSSCQCFSVFCRAPFPFLTFYIYYVSSLA